MSKIEMAVSLPDALVVGGAVLAVVGLALLSVPVAMLVAGVLIAVAGVLLHVNGRGAEEVFPGGDEPKPQQ